MPIHFEKLLTEKEVAEILSICPHTLNVWRCAKRYPLQFIRVGRHIRYRASDVEAFLRSRTVPGGAA
jgi:excisionase family DNA binding protein